MKGIAKALGLADTATEAECLVAINSRGTDLVPKADLDQALDRAQKAEAAISDRDSADLRRDAEVAVNSGVTAGVIAPASRDFWLGLCVTREGLDGVKRHLESAPKIVSTEPALNDRRPGGAGDGSGAKSAEEAAVRAQLGLGEESKS